MYVKVVDVVSWARFSVCRGGAATRMPTSAGKNEIRDFHVRFTVCEYRFSSAGFDRQNLG
jgi:hypothetical protein